jgi:uncharacterized DUF497 family protein
MDAPMEFEWDDAKAAGNLAKHGLSFGFATRIFLDPAHVIEDTARLKDGEDRHKAVGVMMASFTPWFSPCGAGSAG